MDLKSILGIKQRPKKKKAKGKDKDGKVGVRKYIKLKLNGGEFYA